MKRINIPGLALLALLAACAQRGGEVAESPSPSLTETSWSLKALQGDPVDLSGAMREPQLVLQSDGRAVGSGGCNRFSGAYTLQDAHLKFGPLAATRMACPDMQIEDRLFALLDQVAGWRIEGGRLSLLDASGSVLAEWLPGVPK